MKRVWLVPAILVVLTTLTGCVPLSVKISNADRKVELAELIQINKDLIKNNKVRADELKNRKNKLYDEAIVAYSEIAETTKKSKQVDDTSSARTTKWRGSTWTEKLWMMP